MDTSTEASLFGEYLIVTRAEQRSNGWYGFFKINQFSDDGKTSTVFEDEEELEEPYPSREETLKAAKEAAIAQLTRSKPERWS